MSKKVIYFASFIFLLAFFAMPLPLQAQQRVKISFATLAPKASTWGKMITEIVREVYKKTDKNVLIRVYYGGVQGDEHEIEKKIRFHQIDGGFFTGNGLGAVAHEARILEVPGYVDENNVDKIYSEIHPILNKYFRKHGYELLGLMEVGYAYFFSKNRITNIQDISQTKMWVWRGDQLANEMMKMFQIPAVAVDFAEVIPSLQTGLIDGVYATPTALISLEWQKEVKYMLDLPITLVSSGVVFSQKKWNSLTPAIQKIIRQAVTGKIEKYKPIIKKNDEKSIQVLRENTLQIVKPQVSKTEITKNNDVIGKTFPEDLQQKLKELRK